MGTPASARRRFLSRSAVSGVPLGGKAPYGFHTEPIKIGGINAKKLVTNSEESEQVKENSGYLDTWDEVKLDDKRRVVDLMISAIYATSENINIVWKI